MNDDKVVIFGGSFNPPGIHHRLIVEALARIVGQVVVIPCGMRPDKGSAGLVTPNQRAEMALLAFSGLSKVTIDLSDIANGEFARTYDLDVKMKARHGKNVWHAIGTDLVTGGADHCSAIHRSWYKGDELWQKANFIVITRAGSEMNSDDLPPSSELLEFGFSGSSTEIRNRLAAEQSVEGLVMPAVEKFILENELYGGNHDREV